MLGRHAGLSPPAAAAVPNAPSVHACTSDICYLPLLPHSIPLEPHSRRSRSYRLIASTQRRMGKRTAEEAGLPARIRQEPASTNGTGPFVVYFPSRFEPNADVACEWQAYSHGQRRNQYVVVARTVSDGRSDGPGCGREAEEAGPLPPALPPLPLPAALAVACAAVDPSSPLFLAPFADTCRRTRWTLWAALQTPSTAAHCPAGGNGGNPSAAHMLQIGRASCRERV